MQEKTNSGRSPIIDLNSLEYFRPFDGFKAKLFHTETQTYAYWEIEKGAILPLHQHINEQISFVTKGILSLTIDGVTTEMKPGMVAVIPPNTDHSAIALTDVEITDVFSPIRDDFPQ